MTGATTTVPSGASLHMARVPSPVGELRIVVSDIGLRALLWANDTERVRGMIADEIADEIADVIAVEIAVEAHPVLSETARQLRAYFDGTLHEFTLPLDLVGTEFQLAAWHALATIPYGHTVSYTAQAERIGRPKAVRAIGAANGRNPASIVLPCHRVIGADGSLTGFAGGLDAKRFLLDHERAHRRPTDRPAELSLFDA